jgi:hypothetical protein
MADCWASQLGDCDGGISREHVVSDGMFPEQEVFIQGFPWCMDTPKKIRHETFVRKNLCRGHNSALSNIDAQGIATMKILDDAVRLSNVRLELKPTLWNVKRFSVGGCDLERWFLKTLINVAYDEDHPIGSASKEAGRPSPSLVEIAFGLKTFEPRAGLYSLGDVGDQIDAKPGIRIHTFTRHNIYVAGASFYFHGFKFMLFLDDDGAGSRMTVSAADGTNTDIPTFCHHPNEMRFVVNKHLSHVVQFRW